MKSSANRHRPVRGRREKKTSWVSNKRALTSSRLSNSIRFIALRTSSIFPIAKFCRDRWSDSPDLKSVCPPDWVYARLTWFSAARPVRVFQWIGQRVLDDPRNALVREFLRLVAELDAKHFVLETPRD